MENHTLHWGTKYWGNSWGGLFHFSLPVLSMVGIMYLATLPSWFGIIAPLLAGLGVMLVMIWGGASLEQYGLYNKFNEDEIEHLTGQDTPTANALTLPAFSAFVKRSTFVSVSTLIYFGILLAGSYLYINFGVWFDEQETLRIVFIIGLYASMILMAGLLLSMLYAPSMIRAFYDFKLVQHPEILNTYTVDTFSDFTKPSVQSLLQNSLFYGVILILMMSVQVLGIWADEGQFEDNPFSAGVIITILVMISSGVFLFWSGRRHTKKMNQQAEEDWQAYLDEAKAEYGEDSEEYRELIAIDDKEDNDDEETEYYSVAQQTYNFLSKGFLAILFSLVVMSFGLSWYIDQTPALQPYAEWIFLAVIVFVGGGLIVGLFALSSRRSVEIAPEAEALTEALSQADYDRAVELAETLSQKMSFLEIGGLIIVTYITADQFDKARDVIRYIMTAFKEIPQLENEHLRGEIIWLMGVIYMFEQHYKKALATFERAIDVNPNNLHVYLSRAEVILHTRKNPELAIDDLKKAFAMNQELPVEQQMQLLGDHMLMAWALTRLNRRQEADALMKTVLSKLDDAKPTIKSEAYRIAAHVAIERRSYAGAKTFLGKALDADPNGLNGRLARELQAKLNAIAPSG